MSTGQGRSWRPEKTRRARESRRMQILAVCVFLTALVSVVAWLVIGSGVPVLHFVLVTADSFESDATGITPLPSGSAEINRERLRTLAQRYHDANPERVGAPGDASSLADLAAGLPHPSGESLVIYCSSEAWCAPDENSNGSQLVVFLPGKAASQPIAFSVVLEQLAKRKPAQTVLLLELTGRRPGLATGLLSDDVPTLIRRETEAAGIQGLTVICACDLGERSWEYVADATASASDSKAAPGNSELQIPNPLPEFQGTAFGHFVAEAFANGKCGTPAELSQFLKSEVHTWVNGRFGETQTVWSVSADRTAAQAELLQRAVLGKDPTASKSVAATTKDAATAGTAPSPAVKDGSKQGIDGAIPADSAAPVIDDRPVARLAKLNARRVEIARSTTAPALMPVDWIRLQTELSSAEQLVMNGNRKEFDRLHDASLKPNLERIAREESGLAATEGLQPVRDWLSAGVQVTPEEAALFQDTIDEFKVEPGKTPSLRLPPQLRNPGRARQAFLSSLMKDLKEQSLSILEAPADDRAKRIQERVNVLRNLSANGWVPEEFPEQMSTMREVLRGEDSVWLATAMKPLVKLLELRQQALQLAAATNSGGSLLRRESWRQMGPEVDRILMTLHAAERWLSVGPAGAELAADRLNSAESALNQLRQQADQRQRLTAVRDAQRFELPQLLQYLALRLEDVPLPTEELNAACRMAATALNGDVDASEFPDGQLDAIGFTRPHIVAMFALTRDFSRPGQDVSDEDEGHWRLLQSYADDRMKTPLSATERWQLLSVPTLADRTSLLRGLSQVAPGYAAGAQHESSHSGIWLSFWSLRLVESIAPGSDVKPSWQQWSNLVNAVADAKASEVPMLRAVLAQSLRSRWSNAMLQLQRTDSSEVFPSPSEIRSLIAKDVERRLAATGSDNRLLYSGLLRTLAENAPPAAVSVITAARADLELTSANTASASVRVSHATKLYVLNDGVALANPDTQTERNWSHLKIDAVSAEEMTLQLQMRETPTHPKPVTIVAVNEHGAVTATMSLMLHPPAETVWEVEVVQVLEGNPAGIDVELEVPNLTTRRLRLLPSTLDAVTKMHVPTALKFRLKQTRGSARKVGVQLFHADGKPFWTKSEILDIAVGEDTVELPLRQPVQAQPAVPAAASAPPAATVLDFSRGLIIEITPENLLRRVTSRITVIPEFAEPEQFVRWPVPGYNSATSELRIRADRADINDASALQPAKLPVEVVLSDRLSQYVIPGEAPSVPSLPANGHTFTIRFRPEVEEVLGEDGIEFGLSLAGIPHAWWWKLSDGVQTPIDGDTPQIRTFLKVANPAEVKLVAGVPELMLGEGWQKAQLQPSVFLHGGEFDSGGWKLSLNFQRQGTDGRDPATEMPFDVTNRFVEKVTVTPGENNAWLFSTTTEPWMSPPIDPTLRLQNGRYDLIASLRQIDTGAEPVEWPVAFVLDDTGPKLTKFETALPRTKVTEVLRGTIVVTDEESGVKAIRVGLLPDMLEPLTITPGTKVQAEFELDAAKGFPPLLQKETDNALDVSLYIEAENLAGKTTPIKKSVTIYLPGKAGKMEDAPPGGIEVTFNSGTAYVVSVKGPKGKLEPKTGVGSVVFAGLPVGEYDVEWKTDGQGKNAGSQKKVKVSSDKTTTVVGKK